MRAEKDKQTDNMSVQQTIITNKQTGKQQLNDIHCQNEALILTHLPSISDGFLRFKYNTNTTQLLEQEKDNEQVNSLLR